MPELSRLFGIVIQMYYNDHNPPHFHAIYQRQSMVAGINPIRILRGGLPARATSMVLEWAALHQLELIHNWEHVQAGVAVTRIRPLD